MANIVFARTDDPNSKAIKDGQLVFDTSGNGKMYLDNGTERLEMGGSMSVDSVLNAESTNPIQNKAVAGVMLKTLDEVGAVTKAGFIPDALAAKELSDTVSTLNSNLENLIKVKTITKNSGGAGVIDTELPYNSTIIICAYANNVCLTPSVDVGGTYTPSTNWGLKCSARESFNMLANINVNATIFYIELPVTN